MGVYVQNSYAKGMFLFWFLIWYSMWHDYFLVATGTTISCSWGRQYGSLFSLSFLDVYGSNTDMIISILCWVHRDYRKIWSLWALVAVADYFLLANFTNGNDPLARWSKARNSNWSGDLNTDGLRVFPHSSSSCFCTEMTKEMLFACVGNGNTF
jgi:hypothetical protein